MEKLKSFRITALHMEGFKSYSQPTDLTFGDPTVITGGNGRGKSSIADAIAFAVTGLPFFGEHRIDRLHSEDNPDLFIRMRFVDENGTLHVLHRVQRYNAVMYHKALLKGERHMATKAKKKYTYLTKAIQLPDGTRKYIRGKDQKELEEKVLKAQIMVNAGVDICSEETFGHFAQMWYDIYKKPYLRENSQNAIKYVLNQHILPYIGGYRLRDISPMQIQSIMAALSDKSNSLQSKVLIALRSIFKAAQENGLVAKSPVSSMLKPSGKKTSEKVALTPQESDLLLQRVKNDRAYTFLLIALQTGMRRGEIVGLQWSDIDFESRMIRVRHNAVLGRYETTVSELMKTKAGRRDIPMSNEVEAWLRKQRDRSSSKFVLSLKNKKVMTLSSFRSMWKLIERELPETHITAHILRHTYITRLFEAGLDVKEIQYLAGHSTMDMTLSVYTHYDRKNREQQTAEKVRRAFCKEAV